MKEKKQDYKSLKLKLDNIIDWFENEEVSLDDAVEKYEEGRKIIKELEDYLNSAEIKITKLKNEA